MEKSKPKLLIIEDEEDQRLNFHDMLQEDYSLLIAKTGWEAVELFCRHYRDIDLILMDYWLSDMSGLDVYHKMNVCFTLIPPIIVITAFCTAEEIRHYMTEISAFAHLSKPFSELELRDTIKKALLS